MFVCDPDSLIVRVQMVRYRSRYAAQIHKDIALYRATVYTHSAFMLLPAGLPHWHLNQGTGLGAWKCCYAWPLR